MYALSFSAEGDCYWCVPPDPGIAAAALGASASGTPPGTAPAEALHTFTLDSGASRCFFRDSTTLSPLPAPVPVRLADPSGGPVVASSSTVLPCPAVPSGSLSGLHLPSFSTKLVSTAALQDAMVTTTTPGGQRVSICTCTRTGRHLATTSGMGLVLGGWGPVVLTGRADASWVDVSATQRSSQGYTFSLGSGSVSSQSTRSSSVLSSSCKAEIYAGPIAAQELRWLTYLLTEFGEQPRSPPVLYQRGQLRLAYVATRANTADVFTKGLPPGDHQRFVTVLGLLVLLCFFS
ncbi:unnamed protein product [Closterium sp. NIES-53]